MISYIVRRILLMIPVLLGVSLLVFIIAKVTPGDPAKMMAGKTAKQETIDKLHRQLGLDDPVYIQYGRFLWKAVQGDFGVSYRGQKDVLDGVMARFPFTLQLAGAALAIAIPLGIPLGMLAAWKRDRFLDRAIIFLDLTMLSIPIFWLAIMMIFVFGVYLDWVPISEGNAIVMPAIAMSIGPTAVLTILTRGSILEVLSEDYVRTAHSKGLRARLVMSRHVLRNAFIPIVTYLGLLSVSLLTGAVFIENVFARPGLGRFIITAIAARDYPEVQGAVLFTATLFVLINLFVDVLYAAIDPRIRYT
jgi:ABC-type dipeptide/oligopeptide/nickel transport system permease component